MDETTYTGESHEEDGIVREGLPRCTVPDGAHTRTSYPVMRESSSGCRNPRCLERISTIGMSVRRVITLRNPSQRASRAHPPTTAQHSRQLATASHRGWNATPGNCHCAPACVFIVLRPRGDRGRPCAPTQGTGRRQGGPYRPFQRPGHCPNTSLRGGARQRPESRPAIPPAGRAKGALNKCITPSAPGASRFAVLSLPRSLTRRFRFSWCRCFMPSGAE